MNVVQTLGRATFNGKKILKDNGFENVTVLTNKKDLDMAMSVQKYLEELESRVKSGETFSDAVTGAKNKISDTANFVRRTFREIGMLKGQRQRFQSLVSFDDPEELTPDEEKEKDKYWESQTAQRSLRAILELSIRHKLIELDDIRDAFLDMYNEVLPKTKARKMIGNFLNSVLISKAKGQYYHKDNEKSGYTVNSMFRLRRFINESIVLTQEEEDQGNRLNEILDTLIQSTYSQEEDLTSSGDENISVASIAIPNDLFEVSQSLLLL